ncbi:hypothetical protein V1279_000619 [Bradyrhizobium sp. AZCC 1610]
MWDQHYNLPGNTAPSTMAATLPVVALLVLIANGKVKAHLAAIIALVVANIGVMGKMIDAIDRRRLDRNQLVPRRRARDAAGLRLSVHDAGAEAGAIDGS